MLAFLGEPFVYVYYPEGIFPEKKNLFDSVNMFSCYHFLDKFEVSYLKLEFVIFIF